MYIKIIKGKIEKQNSEEIIIDTNLVSDIEVENDKGKFMKVVEFGLERLNWDDWNDD